MEKQENVPARRITVAEKVSQSGNLLGLKQSEISQYLMGMKSRIEQVLPKHITPERFISMFATTVSKNNAIAQCSIASQLGSMMQASMLGFPPVEALGYCYFVPYNAKKKGADGKDVWVKEVQFQIGYKGMIDLARRSGKIKTVYAEVVREGDEFSVTMGLEQNLVHNPSFYHKENYRTQNHSPDDLVHTESDVEALTRSTPLHGDLVLWIEHQPKKLGFGCSDIDFHYLNCVLFLAKCSHISKSNFGREDQNRPPTKHTYIPGNRL